jgi:hypothetical protein
MTCAEIESLICEYVDGALAPDMAAEVERHFGTCPACAEMAQDSAAAVAFISRAQDVEVPPELVTRILFEAPWVNSRSKSKARTWAAALLSPILQPRFAMGMAMTILSFAMLAPFVTSVRQPKLSDLQPARIWASLDEKVYRTWTRTVKFYDNLRFVYQIQTTLREWQQTTEEQPSGSEQDAPERNRDEKKLPIRPAPDSGVTGSAPAPDRAGETH